MTVAVPRVALIHGIACAIEADRVLGRVTEVFRGFPTDDDFAIPSISVTASGSTISKRKRTVYRETDIGGGRCETIFETSRRDFVGTVELWAKDKTSREKLEYALDELFEGDPAEDLGTDEPAKPGLVLELSQLYDARVRVLLDDKNEQDPSGGRDGYFRIAYSFICTVPYLRRRVYKKATFANNATVTTEPFDD